jgi:predicted AAA+ superfamily ATPase
MNEHILSRSLLKEVILEQKQELARMPRGTQRAKLTEMIEFFGTSQILIIQGVRRCGKSTLLAQFLDTLPHPNFHYLNFEDERLVSFDISLFNQALEIFYEVNGKHTLFVFDEIQVIEGWERFVRRLHNGGNKILITGSNANLLSQELGTKLTGRHLNIELFPFSYIEFLRFKGYHYHEENLYIIEERSILQKHFTEYLTEGGMPIYLQNRHRTILTSLYDDIIIRDVLQRYKIDNIKLFRELVLYLISNCTSSITFTSLKEYFRLGSINTVIKYLEYLENCYFLFCINAFSASYKKQINTPKKIYIFCNAFVDKIGFHVTDNHGVLLENLVFLELRRRFKNIFYYKTQNNLEVDFLVYNNPKQVELIQVSWTLSSPATKNRKVNALLKAMEETKIQKAWILTEGETDTLTIDNKVIHVLPIYQWLCS